MDPKSSNLRHRQESQTVHDTDRQTMGREFTTVDEMLQHDATEIEVPPEIAHRLADSVAKEPKPSASWWRRLFS